MTDRDDSFKELNSRPSVSLRQLQALCQKDFWVSKEGRIRAMSKPPDPVSCLLQTMVPRSCAQGSIRDPPALLYPSEPLV